MSRAASKTTKQAKIESLWAKGLSSQQIGAATGYDLSYIGDCVRLIQAHAKMIRPETVSNDDNMHLARILARHGSGFPYYAAVRI